jgi:predicted ATPase
MIKDTTENIPKIIAYTGAHRTGKTTSTFLLAAKLKILHPDKHVSIIQEIARRCPYPINKEASKKAQSWIFSQQLATELFRCQSQADIIITDRTVVDSIAYAKVRGFNDLATKMQGMAETHIHRYKQIFFKFIKDLPLESISSCNDGVRDMDLEWQKQIEEAMLQTYKELGLVAFAK